MSIYCKYSRHILYVCLGWLSFGNTKLSYIIRVLASMVFSYKTCLKYCFPFSNLPKLLQQHRNLLPHFLIVHFTAGYSDDLRVNCLCQIGLLREMFFSVATSAALFHLFLLLTNSTLQSSTSVFLPLL